MPESSTFGMSQFRGSLRHDLPAQLFWAVGVHGAGWDFAFFAIGLSGIVKCVDPDGVPAEHALNLITGMLDIY
jgi:hypothetical protein